MSAFVRKLKVDIYRDNPENDISSERHLVQTGEAFHLLHWPFYYDNLVVRDAVGNILRKNIDYVADERSTSATIRAMTQSGIWKKLKILKPGVEEIYVDYHAFGDTVAADDFNELAETLENLTSDDIPEGVNNLYYVPSRVGNHPTVLAYGVDLNTQKQRLDGHDLALNQHQQSLASQEAAIIAAEERIDTHELATNVHGATFEATPELIVLRDAAGRAKVAAPAAANDIARKAEVDAVHDRIDDIEAGTTAVGKAADSDKLENKTLAEVLALAAGASLSDLMPIGTVLMYDANNPGGAQGGASGPWVDDDTMPGWWACIPENADKGCPNMVDRFPMGKVVAGSGAPGGSASVTLAVGQLPLHNHSINHGHTASSGWVSADHNHTISGGEHTHNYYGTANAAGGGNAYPTDGGRAFAGRGLYSSEVSEQSGYIYLASHNHSCSGISANHTHAITVNTHTGNSGNTGLGESIDIRNPYYAVIFIRKCV